MQWFYCLFIQNTALSQDWWWLIVGVVMSFFCLFPPAVCLRVSIFLSNLNLFLQRLLIGVPPPKSLVNLLESPVGIWLASSLEGKLASSLVVGPLESVLVGLLRFSCTQVSSRINTVKGTRHTSAPWHFKLNSINQNKTENLSKDGRTSKNYSFKTSSEMR